MSVLPNYIQMDQEYKSFETYAVTIKISMTQYQGNSMGRWTWH